MTDDLPGPMFCWDIQNAYLEKRRRPRGTVQCGVPAPHQLGNRNYPPLEPAAGRYVRQKG
jgi:hypothetical protein